MWQITNDSDCTVALFPETVACLSWAPLGGGLRPRPCRAVLNWTVKTDATMTEDDLISCARRRRDLVADALGTAKKDCIVLITTVPQEAGRQASSSAGGLTARAFCTAGLGNARACGELTERVLAGTVNLIVAVDAPLTGAALLEAVSVIAVAKATAVLAAGLTAADGRPRLATGTDCVALCCRRPRDGEEPRRCAGLGTELGRIIATAAHDAAAAAVDAWLHRPY